MIKNADESTSAISPNWVFNHAAKITNIENGFQITLSGGNWGTPNNLDVKAFKDYPKRLYAKQIREGLEYAQSDNGIRDLAVLYTKKPPLRDRVKASLEKQ